MDLGRRRWAVWLMLCASGRAADSLARLPVLSGAAARGVTVDWLVSPVERKAGLYRSESGKELVMTNGLIRRAWRLAPDAATVGFDNLRTGQGMLRGVKPEAVLEVNGTAYDVDGLAGQPDYAYLLPQWVDGMTASPRAFHFTRFEAGQTEAPFAWKVLRPSSKGAWPPPMEIPAHVVTWVVVE